MKQWILVVLIAILQPVQAGKNQNVTLVVDDVPVTQVLQDWLNRSEKTS